MKRRVQHASKVRGDGRYWCLCGYQAPRQHRPGSPKAKMAVEQHVQQQVNTQPGRLIAHVDQVYDADANNITIYGGVYGSTATWTHTAYSTWTGLLQWSGPPWPRV